MDLAKSRDYFDPSYIREDINIIGCGAVGSALAENLVRLGFQYFTIWDDDIVEEKNLNNQLYDQHHIGRDKVNCLNDIIYRINPKASKALIPHSQRWTSDDKLKGHIFMCVDNVQTRKNIVQYAQLHIGQVKSVFDFRMRLTDAQHYAANNNKGYKYLLKTLDFTDEEAAAETPQSACHELLNMCYTTRAIVAYGVANFVEYLRTNVLHKFIQINTQTFMLDAFKW